MKRSYGLLVIGMLLARAMVAQQDVASRLTGHVPPAVVSAVQILADSAATRGLPVSPLVNKALEGAVKGVPPERIVTAVRAVFAQLGVAAGALRGTGVTAPEAIEAGAFAIAAGLDSGDVANVARSADRTHPAATALQVAATLVALGVPRGQGVGLVQATIRSGGRVDDLLSLPSQVQAAMAGGVPPAAAATGLERAAERSPHAEATRPGEGAGEPASALRHRALIALPGVIGRTLHGRQANPSRGDC